METLMPSDLISAIRARVATVDTAALLAALETKSPVALERAVMEAEIYADQKAREHDALEGKRTLLRFHVAMRLKSSGGASSDKAAETLALEEWEYLAHVAKVDAAREEMQAATALARALARRYDRLCRRRGATPTRVTVECE
jgi:hypothetical protein